MSVGNPGKGPGEESGRVGELQSIFLFSISTIKQEPGTSAVDLLCGDTSVCFPLEKGSLCKARARRTSICWIIPGCVCAYKWIQIQQSVQNLRIIAVIFFLHFFLFDMSVFPQQYELEFLNLATFWHWLCYEENSREGGLVGFGEEICGSLYICG